VKPSSKILAIGIAALLSTQLSPAAQTAALPPMSENEQRSAALTRDLGTLIYLHDRAASIGTDEVRKLGVLDKDKRLHGYITERRGDEIRVTFYGTEKQGEAHSALYRVVVPDAGRPHPAEAIATPELLSTYEAGAVAARRLALGERFEPACSRQYNSVVIPAMAGPEMGWVVYLLPGTTEAKVLPVGGAHRVEVNAAGDRIGNRRTYTRACLNFSIDPNAEALVLTHLLDPQPTELHVFWSLQIRRPLMVLTLPDGSMWEVIGQNVRLIERGNATGGQ
jgi:hypothetical protein